MQILTTAGFHALTQPLVGRAVTKVKQWFGSAIQLTLADSTNESTISVYWDWRVEDATTILCGSSNPRSEIKEMLAKFVGLTISDFLPEERLPDLTVGFSNGWRLRSFALVAGDPQWHLNITDEIGIRGMNGSLVNWGNGISDGYHPDPNADREADLAAFADMRWMPSRETSPKGNCEDCASFIRLDGASAFLWWGVCACADSPNDGTAVHQRAGCEAFNV